MEYGAIQIGCQSVSGSVFPADGLRFHPDPGLFQQLHESGRRPPPLGFRTFVVPADPRLEMIWRGQRISGSDLLVFPTGSELHALSEAHFNVYTLSVSEEALFNTASRLETPGLETIFHKREVIHCRPSEMNETRRTLSDLEAFPALRPFASKQILIALVHLLASVGNGSTSPLPKTRRQRIVLDSETLIAKHSSRNIPRTP